MLPHHIHTLRVQYNRSLQEIERLEEEIKEHQSVIFRRNLAIQRRAKDKGSCRNQNQYNVSYARAQIKELKEKIAQLKSENKVLDKRINDMCFNYAN